MDQWFWERIITQEDRSTAPDKGKERNDESTSKGKRKRATLSEGVIRRLKNNCAYRRQTGSKVRGGNLHTRLGMSLS